MIEEVESAIVALLQATFPDLEVLPMPEDASRFKPRNPRGTILVGYAKSQFGDPIGDGNTFQSVRMRFMAAFLLRDLRSHKGSYARLEQATLALAGFNTNVADVNPLFPAGSHFVREFQGTWQYDLEIIATAILSL
jgi:hypothetical protein